MAKETTKVSKKKTKTTSKKAAATRAAAKKAVKKKTIKKKTRSSSTKRSTDKKLKKVTTQKKSSRSKKQTTLKTKSKRVKGDDSVTLPTSASPRLISKVSAMEELLHLFQEPVRKIAYVSAYCFIAVGLTALATNSFTDHLSAGECSSPSCQEIVQQLHDSVTQQQKLALSGVIPETLTESVKVAVRSELNDTNVNLLNLTTNEVSELGLTRLSEENLQLQLDPEQLSSGTYVIKIQGTETEENHLVYSTGFTIPPSAAVAGASTTASTTLRDSSTSSASNLVSDDSLTLDVPDGPALGQVVLSLSSADALNDVELYMRRQGIGEYKKLGTMSEFNKKWFYAFDSTNYRPGKYEVVASYRTIEDALTTKPEILIVPETVVLSAVEEVLFATSSILLPADITYELAIGATSSDNEQLELIDFASFETFEEVTVDRVSPLLITEPDGTTKTALQLYGSAPAGSYLTAYIAGNSENESILVDDNGSFFSIVEAELETGVHEIVLTVESLEGEILGVSAVVQIERRGDAFNFADADVKPQVIDLSAETFHVDVVQPLIKTILSIFLVFTGLVLLAFSIVLRKKRQEKTTVTDEKSSD